MKKKISACKAIREALKNVNGDVIHITYKRLAGKTSSYYVTTRSLTNTCQLGVEAKSDFPSKKTFAFNIRYSGILKIEHRGVVLYEKEQD
jgi:hypothetical protein